MKSRILFATIAAALLGFSGLFLWKSGVRISGSPAPAEKMVLATPDFVMSSLIFVAEQEGLFKRQGLAVELLSAQTGKEALDHALSGRADLAATSSSPLTRAILDGAQPHILATVAKSDRDVVIVANSARGIRQMADLRGKKIAATRGTAFDFFLDVALLDAGVPLSDVTIVNLKPLDALTALQGGTVDAAVQTSPLAKRAIQSLGASAVLLSPPLYTTHWNIVSADNFIAARPAAAEKFLRALTEAESLAHRRPARAIAATADRVRLSQEELAAHWQHYLFRVQLTQSLIVAMEDETRWVIARRDRKSPAMPTPNFLDYLEVEPLRKLRPEAIRITR